MLVKRVEKIQVKFDKRLYEMLFDSTRIYNKALYFIRQAYFETKEKVK